MNRPDCAEVNSDHVRGESGAGCRLPRLSSPLCVQCQAHAGCVGLPLGHPKTPPRAPAWVALLPARRGETGAVASLSR